MRLSRIVFVVASCLLACHATLSRSQDSEAPGKSALELTESQSNGPQAIDFIKSHHPELATLLEVLKTTDLTKYESAIKDVSKVIKRLEAARKRDEKLYELEIEAWKIQSKIDLLLARGMAKDKSFKESDLKQLLENRIDNQMQRTNREIELIDQRRAILVESINKLNTTRQSQVEKQHANMLKRLKGDRIKVRGQEP
jgi:ATP-dependent Lon protease